MFQLYNPLKTSEKQRFFDVFRGSIEMEHWAKIGENT